jgi:asparagine synthase (glutamine-hydrolysing)
MCGICGIYHFEPSQKVDPAVLERMAHSLQHRGPDDKGSFLDGNLGLGHQRLSIIDLTASGHQPMTIDDGRYWIVYNGEIYNYVELRQQLQSKGHSFQSTSDTEVILRLFQQEGENCLQQLNGMFAFAIWDKQTRTLFAARDRLGIKPFYYAHDQHAFLFASEIKALLESGLRQAEVNPQGFADFLTFQFCLGEKTMFKGIHKLLPGHFLWVKPDGTLQINAYWKLDFSVDTDHTAHYFEHQLMHLLDDSVRLQLRADVPVGAHLSGGLDSSTVTCLAAKQLTSSIHTFTGAFKEGAAYDETHFAKLASAHAKSIHHEIYPSARQFVDSMPAILRAMDEPAAGPGIFPQVFVSQLAKQHVKVVLGGQGGDEVFGGYTRYLIAYLEECIRGGIEGTQEDARYVVNFDTILPNLTQLQGYQPTLIHFWAEGLFDAQEARYFRLIDRGDEIRGLIHADSFLKTDDYRPYDAYCDIFNEGGLKSYINKMTRFDVLTLLPALLHVEDRTSMLVSLESRVPLLDHRIVELAASMPPRIKFEGGRSKHIFRKVVAKLLPAEITGRNDKMGFPVPLNEWIHQHPVDEFICDTLLGKSARARGWYDAQKVEMLLQKERPFGRSIWGLLCLELWAQAYL